MDITERKQAEQALRESEEFNRRLVQHAPFGIIYLTVDGVISFTNPACNRIFGVPEDKPSPLAGLNIFQLPLIAEQPHVVASFQELVQDGRPQRDIELSYRSPLTNKDFVLIASATPRLSEDGSIAGSVVMIADITDRKRAEEIALQAARLKSIADLSSGVAHHFNNLLQIVMGNTSLSLADLESGDLSEIKTNLEQMLEAATLGAETVKRLQTFANMRADVTEREGAVFDVATTAVNAAEISKPLWKAEPEKKGIKVDLQLDLEDGCLVKGQENEMFEVLVNLVRNAAEAMPDGGNIDVETHREADEVVITVGDTGIGIAEDDLPRLFQPFWSSKGVGIGKGMGLAMTHGLVKLHGGTISVQSKVGVGTTFTIRLPLAQEPVRKTEDPAMRHAEGHLTILVIEDELHIAALLERIFARAGHRVFKTLSGEEGLAVFHKESVDLVICDLGMPGMNGWDVGKAIRCNLPGERNY